MYHQPESILEQYEVEVHEITKGRGAYICDTDRGKLLLKEFTGSEERAGHLAEFLRDMNQAGFEAEEIFSTRDSKYLSSEETGTNYILKTYISGSECSAKNREDRKQAMRRLAEFHTASSKCSKDGALFGGKCRKEASDLFSKHNKELIKVKNYVRKRKKKNEFEETYQKYYPIFIKKAEEVLWISQKIPIQDLPCIVCHGDFNQHNIVHTEHGWYPVHFESAGYDTPVSDIATFLRKMLEKNTWNYSMARELMESYEGVRPLGDREHQQLYLRLAYPEKFWKIVNQYDNSHKAWISGRMIEKMEQVLSQEGARSAFLLRWKEDLDRKAYFSV